MTPLDYVRDPKDDGCLQKTFPLNGAGPLMLHAKGIRKERTGVHACLSIVVNEVIVAYDTFNIERSEDRRKLAATAHKQLGGNQGPVKQEELQHHLDLFCRDLWNALLDVFAPEMTRGELPSGPPEFVLRPYVLNEGGTILFALPGMGKSYITLLMAVSIDAGVPTFWPVKQSKVLFINLERSRTSWARRLALVNKALGLDPKRPLLGIHARGHSLMEVKEAARKAIKEHGVGLVMLDSISRAGFGDLNENRPVNSIIDNLSAIHPTWLGIAHTPRSDPSHIYGSIFFDAGADVCLQMLSEVKNDGTLGIGLKVTKANDIASGKLEMFAIEFQDFGMCNFRRAREHEFPEIESGKKGKPIDQLADYVLEQGEATATEAARETGIPRNKISEMFKNSGRFRFKRKEGREAYYVVIETNHEGE